jgi:DNA-binding CsgD family transcriptional regulator
MPGEQSIAEFRRRLPRFEVVVLTFHQDPHRLFACFEDGAVGYLTKPIGPVDLMSALQEVRAGGSRMSGPIARLVLRSFQKRGGSCSDLESLTSRELEVLREIAAGSVPKEVATTLRIALRTVQTLRGLNCRSGTIPTPNSEIFPCRADHRARPDSRRASRPAMVRAIVSSRGPRASVDCQRRTTPMALGMAATPRLAMADWNPIRFMA